MMYPPLLDTATASSSLSLNADLDDKLPADLLTPTAVRVIQLVEMPAPPPQRRLPPSSASASSSSSSSSASASEEDESAGSYCSSAAADDDDADAPGMVCDDVDDEEALKMRRILAWRAQFDVVDSPTTPPLAISRKRPAPHSSLSSAPSKRSRTTGPSCAPSPSPAPSRASSRPAPTTHRPAPLLLAPPSPLALGLARRHSSPRTPRPHLSSPGHQRAQSVGADAETLCPACDRRFRSRRAWRAHALPLYNDYDYGECEGEDGREQSLRAACGAAVAYALEACGTVG